MHTCESASGAGELVEPPPTTPDRTVHGPPSSQQGTSSGQQAASLPITEERIAVRCEDSLWRHSLTSPLDGSRVARVRATPAHFFRPVIRVRVLWYRSGLPARKLTNINVIPSHESVGTASIAALLTFVPSFTALPTSRRCARGWRSRCQGTGDCSRAHPGPTRRRSRAHPCSASHPGPLWRSSAP